MSGMEAQGMDSLGALRAFVQAAETGGFTEAGRRLGISPSAVSKAVVRLEERFGRAARAPGVWGGDPFA